MEDIKQNGLDDVVLDAIDLQDLDAQDQSQVQTGNTMGAFLVDLAVRETGILRVLEKYGITKFVRLDSNDPIVMNQLPEDPGLKRALCYQRLHTKYLHEFRKRQRLANGLECEISTSLENWYNGTLRDISNRLIRLNYI